MTPSSTTNDESSSAAPSAAAAAAVVTMESLLGKTLLGKNDTIISTSKALEKKEFVLLYFSASWCPPCRAFSPVLKEFYNNVKDNIEIIYISSDKDYMEFTGYFNTMPWLSLPEKKPSSPSNKTTTTSNSSSPSVVEIKNQLAKMCQVRGIPTLIVLEQKTGLFVTDQARIQINQIMASNPLQAQAFACRELVNKTWKVDMKKVPLSEAQFGIATGGVGGGGSIWSMILSIFFRFLKNPINIFAMLYFFKMFMRKYQTFTGTASEEETTGDEKEL